MSGPEKHVAAEVDLLGPNSIKARYLLVAATRAHLSIHENEWRPALRDLRALDAEWTWCLDFEHDELPFEWRETYALTSSDGRVHVLMSIEFQEDQAYIERLAIAPCNRGDNRVVGVGAALFLHAVGRSIDRGLQGRVTLHSLEDPRTVAFYERMGMRQCGVDAVDGSNMRHFELLPVDAESLLARAR